MENERILLSSLSEYIWCKRRFYLRYIENICETNYFIVDGNIKHENIHKYKIEKLSNIIKCSNIPIHSNKYNLFGKTDEINFIVDSQGQYIKEFNNKYNIEVIESKRTIDINDNSFKVQLCGQILCIEEMYGINIDIGYAKDLTNNKIYEIPIDVELRQKTIKCIKEIEELFIKREIQPIIKQKRCNKCSLFEKCNPNINMVNEYVKQLWEEINDTSK